MLEIPNTGYNRHFKYFKEKTFYIPTTKAEQHAIAAILSDIDEFISSFDKEISKKRQIKEGTMQQLLTGKTRLPGFSGEWVEKTIGSVSFIRKGVQFDASRFIENGKYPMLNGGTEPSGYSDDYNTEGDTITISEGGNSCGFVNYMQTKFWCGGHCYSIEENESLDKAFFFHLLKFNEPKLMKLRVGTGLPNIQSKTLQLYILTYTKDVKEQQAIASILSDMDAEIRALEAERDKYALIKQGMMQELLTGKTRLV